MKLRGQTETAEPLHKHVHYFFSVQIKYIFQICSSVPLRIILFYEAVEMRPKKRKQESIQSIAVTHWYDIISCQVYQAPSRKSKNTNNHTHNKISPSLNNYVYIV